MAVDSMILLIAAAFMGAFITFVLLWPYGFLIAFLGAPFGASFLSLIVSLRQASSGARCEPIRTVNHSAKDPTAAA
jgi:hypothetical protein